MPELPRGVAHLALPSTRAVSAPSARSDLGASGCLASYRVLRPCSYLERSDDDEEEADARAWPQAEARMQPAVGRASALSEVGGGFEAEDGEGGEGDTVSIEAAWAFTASAMGLTLSAACVRSGPLSTRGGARRGKHGHGRGEVGWGRRAVGGGSVRSVRRVVRLMPRRSGARFQALLSGQRA